MRPKTQLCIFTLVLGISGASFSQVLTVKEREDLIGSTIQSCFETQRNTAMNDNLSDDQIRRYCSCYARTLISSDITQQDVAKAVEVMLDRGDEAMVRVLLKGRDLYAIANQCANEALEL